MLTLTMAQAPPPSDAPSRPPRTTRARTASGAGTRPRAVAAPSPTPGPSALTVQAAPIRGAATSATAPRRTAAGAASPVRDRDRDGAIQACVPPETVHRLAEARRWALDLDPAEADGVDWQLRILRQSLRDAFVLGQDASVRQLAEVLRRLLRECALVPELRDGSSGGDAPLEDSLSADLRRIVQRVGLEMGADA